MKIYDYVKKRLSNAGINASDHDIKLLCDQRLRSFSHIDDFIDAAIRSAKQTFHRKINDGAVQDKK